MNLSFKLKVNHLPSVNSIYVNQKYGKGKTLSTQARKVKTELKKQVLQYLNGEIKETQYGAVVDIPSGKREPVKYNYNGKPLTLTMHFYFSKRFFQRDTSNLIKLTEDAIYEVIGVNDAMNIDVLLYKTKVIGSDLEFIDAKVEYSSRDYILDLTKPIVKEEENTIKSL